MVSFVQRGPRTYSLYETGSRLTFELNKQIQDLYISVRSSLMHRTPAVETDGVGVGPIFQGTFHQVRVAEVDSFVQFGVCCHRWWLLYNYVML